MRHANVVFAAISVVVAAGLLPAASAQYLPMTSAQSDASGTGLYNLLEDPANKKEIATNPGAFGSGTPYFAADGVIGASLLSAGVFGGTAAMFFIRGRRGKYAAMGRG